MKDMRCFEFFETATSANQVVDRVFQNEDVQKRIKFAELIGAGLNASLCGKDTSKFNMRNAFSAYIQKGAKISDLIRILDAADMHSIVTDVFEKEVSNSNTTTVKKTSEPSTDHLQKMPGNMKDVRCFEFFETATSANQVVDRVFQNEDVQKRIKFAELIGAGLNASLCGNDTSKFNMRNAFSAYIQKGAKISDLIRILDAADMHSIVTGVFEKGVSDSSTKAVSKQEKSPISSTLATPGMNKATGIPFFAPSSSMILPNMEGKGNGNVSATTSGMHAVSGEGSLNLSLSTLFDCKYINDNVTELMSRIFALPVDDRIEFAERIGAGLNANLAGRDTRKIAMIEAFSNFIDKGNKVSDLVNALEMGNLIVISDAVKTLARNASPTKSAVSVDNNDNSVHFHKK